MRMCGGTKQFRRGAALLVVLFIVMAVTLISLGFVARSDRELACGANMETRMQMDYMAQTGLTHAKNFIINPQTVDIEAVGYWQGDTGKYIEDTGDYYDVSVTRNSSDSTNHCDYTIVSQGYRLDAGDKVSQSTMTGNLRLDPCVALWVGNTYTSETQVRIYGDVYCGGQLKGSADINGDAFAVSSVSASHVEGDKNASVTSFPVTFPNMDSSDLIPSYRIGSTTYSAEVLPNVIYNDYYGPTMSNPAGIYYKYGDLTSWGYVYVYGTLIVTGDLYVRGASTQVVKSKTSYNGLDTNDFPALIVGDDLEFSDYGQLYVEGLAQIKDRIYVDSNCNGSYLSVLGGLFIEDNDIDISGGASTNIWVRIVAAPELTALRYRKASGGYKEWVSVGGSYFKAMSR